MSPTIPLKCRLNCSMKHVYPAQSSTSFRFVSIGNEMEHLSLQRASSDGDAARMLMSISNIVSNELMTSDDIFDDDDGSSKDFRSTSSSNENFVTPIAVCQSPTELEDDQFTWNRVRTVSIDSPVNHCSSKQLSPTRVSLGHPAIVSPMSTPVGTGRPIRKASLKLSQKARRDHLRLPKIQRLPLKTNVKDHMKKALQAGVAKGIPIKKILRKKFSWKNYPELEAFLVANREEYLRHSTLNYTIQQKQYNNRLTERLLELAAEHGYVFDEAEFSFVTVRDRIRCYFKSFVQSAKKRGVIIGYAARKAGLLSEEDLERSAEREGQIITPQNV